MLSSIPAKIEDSLEGATGEGVAGAKDPPPPLLTSSSCFCEASISESLDIC